MKIISVNIGMPKEVEFNGNSVFTGIWKHPQKNPINVTPLKLEGDGVGSPDFHGGEFMAVYCYDQSDYNFWKKARPDLNLQASMMGENITTEGLNYSNICIGDQFKMGGCVLMATLPRIPCASLGIRVGEMKFVKEFLKANRVGLYFKVVETGAVQKGDPIEQIHWDTKKLKIYELMDGVRKEKTYEDLLPHLDHPEMSPRWRSEVENKFPRA